SIISIAFISKILSTVARVLTAREIGQEGMGIFMLITPIMILSINIIQMSFPTSIAKLIAQNKFKTKNIIITTSIIALIINSLFMIILISFSPFIANSILKNPKTLLALNGLALLIPLISMGGLLKGYYAGIGKIEITGYSQVSEEIARIAFILIFGGFFFSKDPAYGAFGAVLGMCAGEVFSLSHMIFSLKSLGRKTRGFVRGFVDKSNLLVREILSISMPLTGGKLIGSLTYFLEPIVINNVLLRQGMGIDLITREYGVLSGYAMPLLLMPGFFAYSFGRVLLQPMTSLLAKNENKKARKLFLTMSLSSLAVGLVSGIILFLFPNEVMLLLYKTSEGAHYVKFFALPFILYYLEAPLIAAMTAINKHQKMLVIDIFCSFIRIGLLFVLLPALKMAGVAIATTISFILLVVFLAYYVIKELYKKKL
ncbi:TPA: oligosaccharide flippase family protein, partial [bacterium]|nr:oligosaccharide flippase family protein [bacterium]